jgi:hypothetical protein
MEIVTLRPTYTIKCKDNDLYVTPTGGVAFMGRTSSHFSSGNLERKFILREEVYEDDDAEATRCWFDCESPGDVIHFGKDENKGSFLIG